MRLKSECEKCKVSAVRGTIWHLWWCQWRRLFTIAAILLSAISAHAQSASQHRFLDKTNIVLLAGNATAQMLDLWATERAMSRCLAYERRVSAILASLGDPFPFDAGCHEINPLMPNKAARYGIKFGVAAGIPIFSYWLHRTGHHKAERWMPVIYSIPAGIGVSINLKRW